MPAGAPALAETAESGGGGGVWAVLLLAADAAAATAAACIQFWVIWEASNNLAFNEKGKKIKNDWRTLFFPAHMPSFISWKLPKNPNSDGKNANWKLDFNLASQSYSKNFKLV